MPRLIRGADLNPAQRREVLSAFVYRWTRENADRMRAWGYCPSCNLHEPAVAASAEGHTHPTVPLQSDEEWLADHAFWFLKDGSRMSYRPQYAQPAWLADEE